MQMNTKTFHAASVQDAIRQARRELGSDAMLLNSKRVPGQKKGQADQFAVSFAYAADGNNASPAKPGSAAGSTETSSGNPYDLAHRVHQRPEASNPQSSAPRPRISPPAKSAAASVPRPQVSSKVHEQDSRVEDGNGPGVTPTFVEQDLHEMQRESLSVGRDAGSGPREEASPVSTPTASSKDSFATESFEKLREQMLSIRKEMLQLAGSVRRVGSASYRQELPSDSLRYLYDLLVEQDFHADLIERILSAMSGTLGSGHTELQIGGGGTVTNSSRSARPSRKRNKAESELTAHGGPARLVAALQDAIASYIDLTPEPGLRRKRTTPLVISLVGPPGAGKTTTLVKLAVRYSEMSRFPLQIISMDNFRVGASEQLRAYAAVLGVGFDTLTTVPALEKAIREYSSKEIILVDTPGLGWRDFDAADELSAFLCSLENTITHMVAPASMKPADFERLADLYEAFNYQSLIFTKLDETTSIGQLVSESWRRQKPLSYFTTGQRIPDDLELASRERICERILPADMLAVNFAA